MPRAAALARDGRRRASRLPARTADDVRAHALAKRRPVHTRIHMGLTHLTAATTFAHAYFCCTFIDFFRGGRDAQVVRRGRRGPLCRTGVVLVALAAPAFAQFDRGTISGTIKDAAGRRGPRRDRHRDQRADTDSADRRHRRAAASTRSRTCCPAATTSRAELAGLQEDRCASNVQLDAAGALTLDFALETGALTEAVTVTAERRRCRPTSALRKTVEAKDIEQLSFSGRNPIGVAGLKAGVIGGNFNNYGFSDLGNGGFNINGSRSDENNITVDGATAIRTRSSGAIVGIQNVDAIQEVQVLTGNYMPEYGRASGGQIRMVTKSGSNRYQRQRLVLLPRRLAAGQHLGAQPQPQLAREQRPGAVRLQAVRLLVRRPDPGHVQGQAVLLRRAGVGELLPGADQHAPRCRRRRCARATSASCSTRQRVLQRRRGSSATR